MVRASSRRLPHYLNQEPALSQSRQREPIKLRRCGGWQGDLTVRARIHRRVAHGPPVGGEQRRIGLQTIRTVRVGPAKHQGRRARKIQGQRRIRQRHGDIIQQDAVRDGQCVGGVDAVERQDRGGVRGQIERAEFLIRQRGGGVGKIRRQGHVHAADSKRRADHHPHGRAVGERAVRAQIIADVVKRAELQADGIAEAVLRVVRGMAAKVGEVTPLLRNFRSGARMGHAVVAVIIRRPRRTPTGELSLAGGTRFKAAVGHKVCLRLRRREQGASQHRGQSVNGILKLKKVLWVRVHWVTGFSAPATVAHKQARGKSGQANSKGGSNHLRLANSVNAG